MARHRWISLPKYIFQCLTCQRKIQFASPRAYDYEPTESDIRKSKIELDCDTENVKRIMEV